MTDAPQTHWQPFAEPWRNTALRTGSLALAIGIGVGLYRRQFSIIPIVTLLALWFTLGGHYLEVLFRNYVQQRIAPQALRASSRLAFWFVGGTTLYAAALATRTALTGRGAESWPWWTGGLVFVGVELVIHLLLQAHGQPSFYNGRG